jgi:hypothetical protein
VSAATFPNGPGYRGQNAGGIVGAVNVVDMGCRGDGFGDDGAQLNKIIANAPSIGAHLIVPPGMFNLATNVTIPTGLTLSILSGANFTGAGVLAVSGSGCIVNYNGGVVITTGSSNPIVLGRGSGVTPINSQTVTVLTTGSKTLTAAQLLGGLIEHNATGASTDTIDSGTNIDAAIPGASNLDNFQVQLANTGSATITIAAGAGITLQGNTALPAGRNAILDFNRTGTGTWKVYIWISG